MHSYLPTVTVNQSFSYCVGRWYGCWAVKFCINHWSNQSRVPKINFFLLIINNKSNLYSTHSVYFVLAGARWAPITGLSVMKTQWSTPASLSQDWWRDVLTSLGCGPWTWQESAVHPASPSPWLPWIPLTELASEVRDTPECCWHTATKQTAAFYFISFFPPTAGPSAPWTGMIKFTEEDPTGMTTSVILMIEGEFSIKESCC